MKECQLKCGITGKNTCCKLCKDKETCEADICRVPRGPKECKLSREVDN